MADPNDYEPSYTFTSSPSFFPAAQLNVEFLNVALSTEEIVLAIQDLRRSDGALNNEIVTLDSLATEVRQDIGEGATAAATAAATSAGAAAGSASTAATSAGQAMGFRNSAQNWAEQDEDTPVNDGTNPVGFSSRHWAYKSESQSAGAEAARDIAAGYASDAVSQGNVPIYAAVAGMGALSVPVGINAIRVNGYAAAGDGGGALYKRVASEPSHAGKFQSTDGAWWALAELIWNPFMLGAAGDAVTAVQAVASSMQSGVIPDATFIVSDEIDLTVPKDFVGTGARSRIQTTAGFTANSILRISPPASTDPKRWRVGNFALKNAGGADNAIIIDLAAANKYISKLTLENITSETPVDEHFLKIINSIPNQDGLFTSVIQDNWSFGGYYLDNVGDSLSFLRNTTTGAGVGYYVNELGTAANILIADGNCTSAGGVVSCVKGANVTIRNMQGEAPVGSAADNDAMVSLAHSAGNLIFNTKIVECNLNTKGNLKRCIYLQDTDLTFIEGNQLYCDPTDPTAAHIYIDTGARNTIVGQNKYFSSVTGAEISPIISDNGIGTVARWKDTPITLSGWAAATGGGTEAAPGVFKSRDGEVQFRGRATGPASVVGDILFQLPVGYRPAKACQLRAYGTAAVPNVILQVLSTGNVQLLTAGTWGINFNDLRINTR